MGAEGRTNPHAEAVREALDAAAYSLLGEGEPGFATARAALDSLEEQLEAEVARATENGRLAQQHWDRAEALQEQFEALYAAALNFERSVAVVDDDPLLGYVVAQIDGDEWRVLSETLQGVSSPASEPKP